MLLLNWIVYRDTSAVMNLLLMGDNYFTVAVLDIPSLLFDSSKNVLLLL